eukprot:TRINITY_DN12289_c0_g1_i1.p1 TRINITY_DN12289_c0_g1~~TRINITY_DN12289_c0_g1_i1.p1  ORF type:complete len:1237 (+),score=281.69 TRINITY_DN12289_c0_g1_i1:61-3771(+)
MAPTRILSQKAVEDARFCRQKPLWQWWIVTPFAVAYAALGYVACQDTTWLLHAIDAAWVAQFHITAEHVQGGVLLLLPCVFFAQVLTALVAYWNVWFRAVALFVSTDDIATATHVHIMVRQGAGASCIAALERHAPPAAPDVLARHRGDAATKDAEAVDGCVLEITYLSRRYRWSATEGRFKKPPLPVRWTAGEYRALRGCNDEVVLTARGRRYGPNRFEVPIPPFKEMLLEHATAPFFVFQMFCVLLWLMDEYWYSALLTGALLWVFEGTVVRKRLDNLEELRSLQPDRIRVLALRGSAWKPTWSDALLPGDVVLLNSPVGAVPADLILVEGSVIVNESMLTGESTPVIKDAVAALDAHETVDPKRDRVYVVYSGTKVLQTTATRASEGTQFPSKIVPGAEAPPQKTGKKHAGKGGDPTACGAAGAVGVVIRTGFETSQGKLMRKIVANSTNRVAAGGPEALAFIGCLLCFAVAASGYVLYTGLQDPNRSRYRLLLQCTMIVTSVVPPELPMELALAVNMTFLLLAKLHIFCTEPFRIPFAGALDTCCFDKTGTLTADVMKLMYLTRPNDPDPEAPVEQRPARLEVANSAPTPEAAMVIAGCHSLVALEPGAPPVGDSMEAAAFEGLGLVVADSNGVATFAGGGVQPLFTVLARHPFVPALQRMSCVVEVGNQERLWGKDAAHSAVLGKSSIAKADVFATSGLYVVTKGSPEAVKVLLRPDSFDSVLYDTLYRQHARDGCRVISLAFRPVAQDAAYAKRMKRGDVEAPKTLLWGGFAVFRCPIRSDAVPTITALRNASQECVMITGDHEYTAAWVAKEVGIAQQPYVYLRVVEGLVVWTSEHDESCTVSTPDRGTSLAVSGEALSAALLVDTAFLRKWVGRVSVWARCSPEQKEHIISALNAQGRTTLMCGDGSNDVGALTRAHVGVGLLPGCVAAEPKKPPRKYGHPLSIPEPLPKDMGIISIFRWRLREKQRVKKYMQHLEEMHRITVEAARRGKAPTYPPLPPMPAYALVEAEDIEDATFAPITKLGDASMAAPFTARNSSTRSTCHLLRLGRCTLVTTLQMYRIMALNCLSNAYGMSVLTQEGVKFSDTQMTVISSIAAVCYLCMSRGTPSETLCREKPHTKLFCPFMVLTVVGQFALHFWHTLEARALAYEYVGATSTLFGVDATGMSDVHPDGAVWSGVLPNMTEIDDAEAFTPCLLNTFVFLLCAWQLVWIFGVLAQHRRCSGSMRQE